MLKMYSNHAHAGSSPEFWEENWSGGDLQQQVRNCTIEPLRPLFEKYSEPGSLMLEGGCGLGQYLAYYGHRGRRVVGVDFARHTLKLLMRRVPKVDVSVGDVSRLPFADETFDLYYSGGVVEHFEHGSEASLREAARVLKKDGVLLMSVPYQSPLRSLLYPLKRHEWRMVRRAEGDTAALPYGPFFQYAFTTREFEALLREAGLRVLEKQGYSVMWGLKELPFMNGAPPAELASREAHAPELEEAIDVESWARDQHLSLAKRLVVSEDARVPVLGLGVRFMRWFASNMMMFVCVRVDSSRST